MFDPKCHELAEYFLADDAPAGDKISLAQAIQDAVEAWQPPPVAIAWNVGDRVRVVSDIEIFPIGIFPCGVTGWVSNVDPNAEGLVAHVKLDTSFPSLETWDNELQVWRDNTVDSGCACTISMFEVLTDGAR